jgi:hypothetical protein
MGMAEPGFGFPDFPDFPRKKTLAGKILHSESHALDALKDARNGVQASGMGLFFSWLFP